MRSKLISVTKSTIEEFKKYLDQEKIDAFSEEVVKQIPLLSNLEYDLYVSLIEQNVSQMIGDINKISATIEQMQKDGCKGKITIKHCYMTTPSSYYAVSFEKVTKKQDCSCKFVPSEIKMQGIGGCISNVVLLELYIYRNIFQEILKHIEKKLQEKYNNLSFEYGDLYQKYIKVVATSLANSELFTYEVVDYKKFIEEVAKNFVELSSSEYNGKYNIYNEYVNILEPCISEVYDIKHRMQDSNIFDYDFNDLTPGPRGLITVLNSLSYAIRHSKDAVNMDFGPVIDFIKLHYKP